MNIYKREKYLRRLRGFFHDTEMIKVITGVRRCGKSCLMASIADELRESGNLETRIPATLPPWSLRLNWIPKRSIGLPGQKRKRTGMILQ